MKIALNIRVDDKLVRDRLGRIRANLGIVSRKLPLNMARIYAERIQDEADVSFKFPTGKTRNSIKAKKTEEGAVVTMVEHGWFTSEGRGLSKGYQRGTNWSELDLWAERAGINKYALVRSITKGGKRNPMGGTRPTFFIEKGIRTGNEQSKLELEDTVKVALS